MNQKCRCGFYGNGDHPCHNKGYTCRKPAKQRFISLGPTALTGVQLKVSAYDTWACDECWEQYRKKVNDR